VHAGKITEESHRLSTVLFVLPVATAAVALFVGSWHLLVYVRGLRDREHLAFSSLCFGFGAYDLCAAANYASVSLERTTTWQHGQYLALAFVTPSLLWFILVYTRQRLPRLLAAVTAFYALSFVLVLASPDAWVLTGEATQLSVAPPWGGVVTYRESAHGAVANAMIGVSLLVTLLVVGLTLRYAWRARGEDVLRSRQLLWAVAVLTLGGINDAAVSMRLYSFIYVVEHAYLGVILLMTYAMSTAVIDGARTRAEAKRSQQRLQRIFDHVQDVYIETNLDGAILELSPSAEKWLGPIDRLKGTSVKELYLDAQDRDELLVLLSERGAVRDRELRVRLPTGTVIDCAVSAAFTRDDDTGEKRIVGSLRDISARKRAEEERSRLERQMQDAQKLESLGILAGGIAHDFNNLLTGILGGAELARLELADPDSVQHHLDLVRQASLQASELCRQMLAYSGKGRVVVEPLDLSRVAEEMRELVRASVSKRLTLGWELGEKLDTVEGDGAQIRQILLNLVVNAAEAIGDAPGRITIRTSSVDLAQGELSSEYSTGELGAGRYVCLEVSDTGCGFDLAARSRLFDPFFSTKFAGRGLGLAVVLGIVRSHRGAIEATSEPGRGSTFRVLLPASTAAISAAVAKPVAPEWKGRGLVLLADDEVGVRKVGQRMLERLGYEVRLATNGNEAVEVFSATPADYVLVITDVTMPGQPGPAVTREIRRIRPDVPVLWTSGYSAEFSMDGIGPEDRVGFIHKPFTWETFSAKVRSALEVRTAEPSAGERATEQAR
jgi:PAS domain S-box-containing protein